MSVSKEFCDLVTELLQPFGAVEIKRMFGGAGVYHDGMMFGLIADEELYFKRDSENLSLFEEAGLEPFIFTTKDGAAKAMAYHRVPEDAMDDSDVLVYWARIGFEAALRAQQKKKPKKRRKET